MDKSTDAFRTIGEMARQLGVKTHILRYWEEQFPTLQPLKRAGGRRHYRPSDVTLLTAIHRLLNTDGYTIKGARNYLAGGGMVTEIASSPAAAAPVSAAVSGVVLRDAISVSGLRAVRERLVRALEIA